MNNISFQSQYIFSKKRFFYFLAIIGMLIFSAYAFINLYLKDFSTAILEFVFVVMLLAAIILINFPKYWNTALFLGSLTITFISIHNYSTGGFDSTGLYWVYMFPPIIFMVQGYKKGLYWSIIFYAILLIIFFLHLSNVSLPKYFSFPYSTYTLIIFLISLAIILILFCIYQREQERFQKLLNVQIEQNKKVSENLRKSLFARDESFKKTEEKTNELETLNSLMIGRELKIIELKNKIKELEENK
ncbi:MAG: hypothetical protein WC663_01290 [Patescibacteria group bacterium]|jgi:hypothetical protein